MTMQMLDPPHPGEIIREDCLAPLNLTVTAAANWLGISRQSMSELLNGRNGLSAEMAIRLEKAGWGKAETWLGVQLAHDLWQVRQRADAIMVKPYPNSAAVNPT
jgi:addiction module HigA family antidote